MKKLGQSIVFKVTVFLVTIGLVALMLTAAVFLLRHYDQERMLSVPFSRSVALGSYLHQTIWNLTQLEKDLGGAWPANGVVELKNLSAVAPTLNVPTYKNLAKSSLQFYYRNETTGNVITNIDSPALPADWATRPEIAVNHLLSGAYAFHLDYQTPNADVRTSSGITVDDLPQLFRYNPPALMDHSQIPVQLTIGIDWSLEKTDELRSLSLAYEVQRSWTIAAIIGLAAAALLFLAAWIFLIRNAGRHKAGPDIRLSFIDRIYGEILILGILIYVGVIGALGMNVYYYASSFITYLTLLLLFYVPAGIVLLSLVRRQRAGILWQQTLSGQVFRLIRQFYENRSLFWKCMLAYLAFVVLAYGAVNLVAGTYSTALSFLAFLALVLLPGAFILLPAASWALQFQEVSAAAEKMGLSAFNLDWPKERLKPNLRKLADTLAATHERVQLAVAEQTKSERLKTDLISNVSHDLRTPLTSIISYVDLLKQERDNPEKRAEYLDILEQKAQRLKVLTDNLFEAAKASSGSLPVQKGNVNLNELVHQLTGEYADRLTACGLTLVVSEPRDADGSPAPVELTSDGGHLWRILDNLMANVCKYALSGTRVYLAIRREAGEVVLELKNVSRESLNCSADELRQRFVRGDLSRSTEGSGLGLAIAGSLAELLGGRLDILLDGDLFKVNVVLPDNP